MNIEKEIAEFANYLTNVKNRPNSTVYSYCADLRQFQSIMARYGDLREITLKDINNDYIGNLVHMELSATTRARKISALKTFYKYLHNLGYVQKNITVDIDMPKIPKKVIKTMSNNEVSNILLCANNDSKTANGDVDWFRNITMLKLMLNTAIRREEIVNIGLKDISMENNSILIHGKGDKERMVYFNNDTKAFLSEYIASHRNLMKPAKTSPYLFVTIRAEKMNVSTVNIIYNKYRDMANLKDKGYTVHSMRKTSATNMYQKTGDIYAVKGVLGHSSIATTEIYAKLGEESKKRVAMAIGF